MGIEEIYYEKNKMKPSLLTLRYLKYSLNRLRETSSLQYTTLYCSLNVNVIAAILDLKHPRTPNISYIANNKANAMKIQR